MGKIKDIEKALFPNCKELKKAEDGFKSTLVDAELDAFECSYYGDDCVHINTEELSYVCLTESNLRLMLDHIEAVKQLSK
jgi:hypothetical protein